MNTLLYSILLLRYGVTYIDCIKNSGDTVIYGYNKSTKHYSFWKVVNKCNVKLLEECESKYKAIFSYRILSKGI